MLRGAISISQGKIGSSTILRKLGTYSRKNKLYSAFCELGRVVRTMFLLHLIRDEELRRTINAATNTSEAWNGFVPWVAFGGEGVIRQNNREEQRKIIRYNHLVANLVVFHHVVSMTRVLQELVDAGYVVTPEIIARLSPYKTEHINRFGHYERRFDHVPPPVPEELRLSPAAPEVRVICEDFTQFFTDPLLDDVCREVERRRNMLHELSGHLLPVVGKTPFPVTIFQEDDESQSIHTTLIREQCVFLGEQREMVREFLWGEILAHRHLLWDRACHKRRFLAHPAVVRDSCLDGRTHCATSRAPINVPVPTLWEGLWHQEKGAPHASWLCASLNTGPKLHAPARHTGAEWLCEGISGSREWGENRTPSPGCRTRVGASGG